MPLTDADFHSGPVMRLEELPRGQLAWVYLKPHKVTWDQVVELVEGAGYEVTEERRSRIDFEVGACIRYLCRRM